MYCKNCGAQISDEAVVCPQCGKVVNEDFVVVDKKKLKKQKNKIVAALLAFFLGGLGIHKFYLGQVGWGIVYAIFVWTFIPQLISFFEGIALLLMDDDKFDYKYNQHV
jgi:TM2 domain-containing membrane protein YozV